MQTTFRREKVESSRINIHMQRNDSSLEQATLTPF